MKSRQITILCALAVIVTALFFADRYYNLREKIKLDYIKEQQDRMVDYYHENPVKTVAVYMGAYVVVTALSLPGAVPMSLVGGAVFGVLVGTIAVSFSSTIGATLAFLVSRSLLQETIQSKWGDQLKTINEGVEREGAFYLFSLRLVPVMPFFLINILMALTPIRVGTFYIVSQIGMLAGTIAYIFAGTQLASIESTSDILSPGLLGAFAVLGLLPLVTKKFLGWLRTRKGNHEQI